MLLHEAVQRRCARRLAVGWVPHADARGLALLMPLLTSMSLVASAVLWRVDTAGTGPGEVSYKIRSLGHRGGDWT